MTNAAGLRQTSLHNNDFLALLPTIRRHAQFYFRHLRAEAREEALAETVAAAFVAYVNLLRRGRQPSQFPSMLARFAVLHVVDQRHVGSPWSSCDVLSRRAQQQRGFRVRSLQHTENWHEAVADNTQTPVPDQVSFRNDFPRWRTSRCERDRRLIDDLMVGERAVDMARKYGLTPARISELRREFHDDWSRFCSDLPAEANPPTAGAV